MKKTTYYRVMHPSTYANKICETYDDARTYIDEEYLNRNKKDGHDEYWQRIGRMCYIEEVIEISSVIQKPTVNTAFKKGIITVYISENYSLLPIGKDQGKMTILVYQNDDVNDEIDRIKYDNDKDYYNDIDILEVIDVI